MILAQIERWRHALHIKARLQSHHKFNEHQTAEAFAARIAAGENVALPPILAPDIPRMELYGNRAFYMDRHRGVLGYSTETVDINGGSVVVRITGWNLQLQAMTDEELRIDGIIEKIEFVE